MVRVTIPALATVGIGMDEAMTGMMTTAAIGITTAIKRTEDHR